MTRINPTIIAVTGMPGAGKSTFTKAASQRLGLPVWYVGQPLLEECKRLGLAPTYANRMDTGWNLGLFNESAPLKFMEHSYAAMRAQFRYPQPVIFDSLRSLEELEFLKRQQESVILVAVLSDRAERHRRLLTRDNSSPSMVQKRDQCECGAALANQRRFQVGQLIALADHYILSSAPNAPEFSFLPKSDLLGLSVKRNGHPAFV